MVNDFDRVPAEPEPQPPTSTLSRFEWILRRLAVEEAGDSEIADPDGHWERIRE